MALVLGCTSSFQRQQDELQKLLAAYRENSAALRAASPPPPADRIEATRGADGVTRVTVVARQAPLGPTLARLLTVAGKPYVYEQVDPGGRVTASLDQVPLPTALELLLAPYGFAAEERDGVIVIRSATAAELQARDPATKDLVTADAGGASAPLDSGSGPPFGYDPYNPPSNYPPPSYPGQGPGARMVQQKVTVAHLDAAAIQALLRSAYQPQELTFAFLPSTNAVLLRGTPDAVERASALLHGEDLSPYHVMIEVLVVEYSREELVRLNFNLSQLSYGRYADLTAAFGSLTGDALRFTRLPVDPSAPLSYTAFIQALQATDHARLIARPFVATRSGDAATIDVTRSRYVIVDRLQDGATFTSTQPVTSGVILRITPTVMPSGEVKMSLDVEESQFVPTGGNVSVEVGRRRASSLMQVGDGETIVIGGLTSSHETDSDYGVPGLRKVPVLNLLFGTRSRSSGEEEVSVFVTPHIWRPSMEAPLSAPGALDKVTLTPESAAGLEPPSAPPH